MRTSVLSRRSHTAGIVPCFAAILLVGGCRSSGAIVDWKGTPFDPDRPRIYTLYPGDRLLIRSAADEMLNQEVRIRADGNISLLYAGDVRAAGRSPEELADALNDRLREVFKTPNVAVIVVEESGRRLYVGGEVQRPGSIPLRPRQTLVQALLEAGGFSDAAEPKSVLVMRSTESAGVFVYKANVERVLAGLDPDVPLEPSDIVYAPASNIAKVDRFVEQYINAIVPRVITFPFTTNVNTQRVRVVGNTNAGVTSTINR